MEQAVILHESVQQQALNAAHIHTANAVGGAVFVGALWAHLPSLAWYTAAVGAIWYTCLAVRQLIQSYCDVKTWLRKIRQK